jgi:hypothetical protein
MNKNKMSDPDPNQNGPDPQPYYEEEWIRMHGCERRLGED